MQERHHTYESLQRASAVVGVATAATAMVVAAARAVRAFLMASSPSQVKGPQGASHAVRRWDGAHELCRVCALGARCAHHTV